ncbi:RNA polymerase II transcription factor SIII, subunit A [Ophiocordyceps camponoti-floridani]|uniref:RNA polymerase II transcription factor SIII, subunit A n=1 Tax=Ophiocordyceps camponoti-floridani TaxID=2030778 RepID=A0A8H4Q171_9HYPO|nr:RNA polymerase II transcription factor SIII, subunit A [Ophiocordyceps camponoti-floridani]
MPVKSLMELAAMACIKNIRGLNGIGDYLPYSSMRQILLKVDNASQLRQIEVNSPQLQGETGEIWIKIIEKDFPLECKANAYKPPTPDKWYRVWEKYKKEHDDALEESQAKLATALAGLRQDKEKNTSKIVERKFLPRAGRVGPKRLGPRDNSSSALTFNLGSRTKTHTGASIMRKVRREVREIATIHGPLSKPTRAGAGASDLKKAPASMVSEHQRASQPQFRTSAQSAVIETQPSSVEQYEKRATVISDSEEEIDDYDHDVAVRKTTKQSSSPHVKTSSTQRQDDTTSTTTTNTNTTNTTTTSRSVAGRGSATLANKFGHKRPRPTIEKASPEPTPQASKDADPDSYLPSSRTVREGSFSPHSAEEVIASLSPPPPQAPTRKRKAVDIFMRPKKRVN